MRVAVQSLLFSPTASPSTCHGSSYLPPSVLRPWRGHSQGVQGPARDSACRYLAANSSVPMNTEQRCQAPAGSSEVRLTSWIPAGPPPQLRRQTTPGVLQPPEQDVPGTWMRGVEVACPHPDQPRHQPRGCHGATRPPHLPEPPPGAEHWRALHRPTGLHLKLKCKDKIINQVKTARAELRAPSAGSSERRPCTRPAGPLTAELRSKSLRQEDSN